MLLSSQENNVLVSGCFCFDAKNSSAGYEMVRNFKVNKLGTLIGEKTGGSQQGINGEKFFFLTLPHSKYEVNLPLIFNYHSGKPASGIAPKYRIMTIQQSIALEEDNNFSTP